MDSWKMGVLALACALAVACSAQGGASSESEGGEASDGGLACDAALPSLETLAVTVEGTGLFDALGRELLLRGVNAGGRSKIPPFLPFAFQESGDPLQADAPPFDEALAEYADRVVDWGHDVVRLPFTWDAMEPEQGRYDLVYLDRYSAMAAAFGARGIRVIVDFHQDVFARTFCGDGFPLWAVLDEVEPKEGPCHDWFMGYLEQGPVAAAYDAFWANEADLQGQFKAMWRHVASHLHGVAGVIGFEIINEPGWGTMDRTEFLKTVLTPFYSEMIGVIREEAPGVPVFFDATGFDAVEAATALDLPEGEGIIFAPHFYDPPAILQGIWTGTPDYSGPIGAWREQGDAWDVPVLVGEFGLKRTAEGSDTYVRLNFEALDVHRLHGTLWEYSATVDDWNEEGMSILSPEGEESSVVVAAVRAYPIAVDGTLISIQFDAETRELRLVLDTSGGNVTEIATPTRLYPEGVSVQTEGVEACTSHDLDAERVGVRAVGAGRLTVTLGPAQFDP